MTIIVYSAGDASWRSVGDGFENLESNLGASDQKRFGITEIEKDRVPDSGSVGAGFKDLRSDASDSSGIPLSLCEKSNWVSNIYYVI